MKKTILRDTTIVVVAALALADEQASRHAIAVE